MGIADHIGNEVLGKRLGEKGVLVVYDKDRRYRDLCLQLANDTVTVVDASESSIESREAAARAFYGFDAPGNAMGSDRSDPQGQTPTQTAHQLLIYIPAGPPLTDEDRQMDPFSAYAIAGAIFPDGDGDDYLALCLKAKPDHAIEIRRLFEQDPSPSFALIDNVGGGLKWPTLRTLLEADSAGDILRVLLLPSQKQKAALEAGDTWVAEARALLAATLGLKLITRGKTWESVANELWRFLLFSEFAYDLPGDLPPALADVPRAPASARPLVEGLCDRLRNDIRTKDAYIERAEEVEKALDLPGHCRGLADLGSRDTFPFEERVVLARAVAAFEADRLDDIRAILDRHRDSVWTSRGESQEQWGLLEAALRLAEACDDAQGQLPDHARSLDQLVEYYAAGLSEVDRRQREFEQARADIISHDDAMAAAIEHARGRYRRLVGQTGTLFTRHLETVGWPLAGRLANADVFDSLVEPLLREKGSRVAYILVDALRYELGVALYAQLADTGQAELQAACAQLPTVTPVGMASLLPGAGSHLSLVKDGDSFVAMLDGVRLLQVGQRMEVLRGRYGDRFAEMDLSTFIKPKAKIPATADLLVLRSNDMDAHLENDAKASLGLIHQTLKTIRVAIHKLKSKDLNFANVVVATDHGFFLNVHAEAGDVCSKPPGSWIIVHDRSLLGDGSSDANNFALPTEKLGIRSDFPCLAGPRTMAAYRRGLSYFHGGASLQEAVVPVLTVRLRQAQQPQALKTTVKLTYKDGAKRITTRLPVVSLLAEAGDMFALHSGIEVLLEAHDRKSNVVGEAKPGGAVNAATGTITLKPGEPVQVAVRMNPEYQGKFTLKALNPMTLATYDSIDMETDYAV